MARPDPPPSGRACGGPDAGETEELQLHLLRLCRQGNLTLLVANTHALCRRACEVAIVLSFGRKIAEARPAASAKTLTSRRSISPVRQAHLRPLERPDGALRCCFARMTWKSATVACMPCADLDRACARRSRRRRRANGAGKSSLLRALLGIEKPTNGRVEFGGRDVTSWPRAGASRKGWSRSRGRKIINTLTVNENC